MKRKALLNLFQQNTGRTATRPPRVDPTVREMHGYQNPRVFKFKWQGKVE